MAPKARSRMRAKRGARQVKVVVTGPFGAGKTTLIRSISEITVLSTERKVSDHTAALKTQTTVAMDFGRLTVSEDLILLVFGTPGQRRFDFMWEILAEGMLGFVVLVDATRESSIAEAHDILESFTTTSEVPYVVAVNKCDGATDLERVAGQLSLPEGVPCIEVDARDRESVKSVLLALLHVVLDEVEASAAASA